MKFAWSAVLLLTIFMFSLRLWLSLSTPDLSDDMSYHTVRQLDHMLEHGSPFEYDALSSGGREVIVQPFWYLLYPLAQLTSPIVAVKIFTNFVAALLIPAVFLITVLITKSPFAGVLSSMAAILAPLFMQITINTSNPLALVLLLLLVTVYFLLRGAETTNERARWWYFVAAFSCYLLGVLLHISASMLLFALLLFMAISKTQNIPVRKSYKQFWILSFVMTVWLTLVLYKRPLIMHGVDVLYQNIPFTLRAAALTESNYWFLLGSIGVFPLLAAAYAFFQTLETRKMKGINLLSAFGLSAAFLGMFTVLPLEIAGAYVAIAASILIGPAFIYFEKSIAHFRWRPNAFFVGLFVVLLLLFVQGGPAVVSALTQTIYHQPFDDQVLNFLEHTEDNAVVIWSPHHAQEIMYRTGKMVAVDSNFLLVPDAQLRMQHIQTIHTSRLVNDVVSAINALGGGRENPAYIVATSSLPAVPADCLIHVFSNPHYIIYRSTCEVTVGA